MRIYFLLTLLLVGGFASAQTLEPPIDFESTTINYTFTDFDGGAATVIANPQMNANNMSATVAQMVKGTGQPWGGSLIEMTNPLDFSVNKVFTMKVYSPRVGARCLFKVEDPTNGAIFFEKEDTSTVANDWETLTFDFSGINTSNTYQKIVLIFDLGTVGDGSPNFTWLFDDIQLVQGSGGNLSQIDLPVTFEDTTVDYTLTDFGGNAHQIVVDPTNSSNTVAQIDKTAAAELWAGTTISTANGFASVIPFSATDTEMSVRVWSPDANIPVRLKVEDKTDPQISCETEAMTTVAGQWETLTFDFTNEVSGTAALNVANTYDLASIFFNFGTDGATAGAKTYYFDDVEFVGASNPLNQIDLPVTFEDPMVDYTLTDFGGNAYQIVADPTNASNTVAEVEKTAAAQTWAGTTVSTPNGLASAIPFTAGATIMSVRVWSPDANTPIRLKVEDKTDGNISVEAEVNTTQAMAWEWLEFDFTNEVSGTPALDLNATYDMASIFFNFGTDGATAGSKTYYFDDLYFGTALSVTPEASKFEVYPNPARDQVKLRYEGTIEQVQIFNLMGQEVLTAAPQASETTLDITELSRGMYVAVAIVDGQKLSFRLTKE